MGIVSRISKCARDKGFTLAEIERACNFGANTIYRWDKNSPSLEKVLSVADLIGVSVDYLATGKNVPGSASLDTDHDSTLSNMDQELLKCLHSLNEETQRDVLGYVRLLAMRYPDLQTGTPGKTPS
jgi:transcriptional regulator with XRE-family HTH domain